MTRYLPNHSGGGAARYNPGTRPPLEMIPNDLANLICERDRIREQVSVAETRLNELGADQKTEAARQADDAAATKAARAGKPIPEAKATLKLELDRAAASRDLEAQRAALAAVTNDCDDVADKLGHEYRFGDATGRADTRSDLREAATALAARVQDAVNEVAVNDWLVHGVYNTNTEAHPTDVVDLARYGLDRRNTSPIDVRDVLVAAATTLLDHDES